MLLEEFTRRGWVTFPAEEATLAWVHHALPAALHALKDPALAAMYQCEETWFVGLDALPNDTAGAIQSGPVLSGAAVRFATELCGTWPALHRGQLSVVFPGYPRARTGESAAAFRYRQRRDAAHVDGVTGIGTPKRRFVREPHRFILGVALNDAAPEAAPLVVWDGSHEKMKAAFRDLLKDQPNPAQVDVTEAYQTVRALCFETCPRVPLPLKPGEAVLLDRMALHGVAPWAATVGESRMIAYFRPPSPSVAHWLQAP